MQGSVIIHEADEQQPTPKRDKSGVIEGMSTEDNALGLPAA